MYKIISFLVLTLALTSCGGGGGGNGGGSSKSSSTGVRVLHAAIDAPPVDTLVLGSEEVVGTSKFAVESNYVDIGTGDVSLTLTKAKTPTEVISTVATSIEKHSRKSILLYGAKSSIGLHTVVLDDSQVDVSDDQALVRIVSGAVGTQALGVSVNGDSETSGIELGSASSYLSIPAGEVNISISSGNHVLYSGRKTYEGGKVYTLLVAGEIGAFVRVLRVED